MATKSETGWSKDTPNVNGVYWWRWPQNGQRIVYEVYGGKVFLGMQEQHPPKDGEWLGPITPADAEQLAKLHEESLKGICVYCGEIQQYESLEQKASEEGNALRVAHIKQCSKRPELKLIEAMVELHEAATAMIDALRIADNRYAIYSLAPNLKATATALRNTLGTQEGE